MVLRGNKKDREVCYDLEGISGQRALNSLLRVSQARAWLAGREQVELQDLLKNLPYVLAHRIELKKSVLAIHENTLGWLAKKVLVEVLPNKISTWNKVLDLNIEESGGVLQRISREDMVIADYLRSKNLKYRQVI